MVRRCQARRPKWCPPLKRVGSCSELPAALLQIPQAAVEVLAGELPADRPGLATVLGPEGEQACLEVLQVVRHGRRQQLALDDAEEDLSAGRLGGPDLLELALRSGSARRRG